MIISRKVGNSERERGKISKRGMELLQEKYVLSNWLVKK